MLDFMILGAQKAATSTLQSVLSQSNEVFMPPGESPFFEDPNYGQKPWLSFTDPAGNAKFLGIKRPDYLCTTESIDRIARALPDLRFIVVLREPISRAISSYYHMVRHGFLPVLPLNEGMRHCIEQYHLQSTGRTKTIIQYGLYGAYIEKWYKYYSRDRFLVLSDRFVIRNIEAAVVECLEYLGVESALRIAPDTIPKNIGVYNPLLLRLSRVAQLMKTDRILVGDRRIVSSNPLSLFFGQCLSFLTKLIAPLSSNKPGQLNQKLLAELTEIYTDDLIKLRRMVDKEAIYWDYSKTDSIQAID